MTDAEGDTIFLVAGIGIVLTAEQRRRRRAAADRAEGLAAARDFRRRMDEAYAQADFPVDERRVRRGV